jgi:hypothetical protein
VARTCRLILLSLTAAAFSACCGSAEAATTSKPPSKFCSQEDGWLDVSDFLGEKYGFLPIVMPITEPAVGYGAAAALAFIDKPLGGSDAGFDRPNISMVGGFGTENSSWGTVAGDLRHWLEDRLQTLAGVVYASVNLDFYGLGNQPELQADPLRYNLEPVGGMVQAKYRLGGSRFWAGLSYAFALTKVAFEAPSGTVGLPVYESDSQVGGLTALLTYDSRDNIFTPICGTYAEISAGFFSEALGGDDEFQRAQLVVLHYVPLHRRLFLGLRGQISASFGDEPFYLRPFIALRGVPMLRYQGEEMALLEAELRWQFWKRFSLVGFVGTGAVWTDFERLDNSQGVVTGGAGFRYEIARKYGVHMGMDVAFGPDNTAIYVQVGSAWARP